MSANEVDRNVWDGADCSSDDIGLARPEIHYSHDSAANAIWHGAGKAGRELLNLVSNPEVRHRIEVGAVAMLAGSVATRAFRHSN